MNKSIACPNFDFYFTITDQGNKHTESHHKTHHKLCTIDEDKELVQQPITSFSPLKRSKTRNALSDENHSKRSKF